MCIYYDTVWLYKKCYDTFSFLFTAQPIKKYNVAASIHSARGLEQDTPLVGAVIVLPSTKQGQQQHIIIYLVAGGAPILANDGRDHHKMASNRYEKHLTVFHQITTADITKEDLPILEMELENK